MLYDAVITWWTPSTDLRKLLPKIQAFVIVHHKAVLVVVESYYNMGNLLQNIYIP